MGVSVLLSLDSGVPLAVLGFLLLLFFRAMREEAAIEEVVGVVSLVWRFLFQDEVSEANVPTTDQEKHGADLSPGLDRQVSPIYRVLAFGFSGVCLQLTGDTASDNVAYGNERLQTIIRKSI